MGSILNRGSKRAPVYYVKYRDVDGTIKRKHSREQTLDGARAYLATVEKRVRDGLPGIPDAEETAARVRGERAKLALTVRDLADRFLGDVEGVPGYAPPRIKSLANYRHEARKNLRGRLPETFQAKPAALVRLADVEALRDNLTARGLAGASVVQTLATLSKLFTWGRKVGLVEIDNPVKGTERPRTASSIDYLDAAEVGRLLAHVEARAEAPGATWEARTLASMVAVAIYCGLRKGELLGLRWRDVHLDAGRLDVLRSYELVPKSGKPRHVPLHPEAVRVLRAWHQAGPKHAGLVFPVEADPGRWRMGDEGDMFEIVAVLVEADCHLPADGHPWHMLRHTFASHFVMRGGNLLTLQRLLGHSTPIMTQRYAHLAPDFLGAEVARLSFAPPPPAAEVADLGEARRARAERAGR